MIIDYLPIENAYAVACHTSLNAGNTTNVATGAGVRAAIAAYDAQMRDQGLVVVRADDLDIVTSELDTEYVPQSVVDAWSRLVNAVVAHQAAATAEPDAGS